MCNLRKMFHVLADDDKRDKEGRRRDGIAVIRDVNIREVKIKAKS